MNPTSLLAPLHDLHPSAPDIAADVIAGLSSMPRSLPSKYFYDARGSRLFERICETPEYYLTRAELSILRQHADAIADALGPQLRLVEYGTGEGEKTRRLLAALSDPAAYLPVEISRSALIEGTRKLARAFPRIELVPVCADFTEALQLPTTRRRSRRTAVYLAGSTLGNFEQAQAIQLLRQMRETAGPGGALLLGLDLKKDPQRIHAAYNDAAGITAAFTLNLLQRLNTELGADFDPDQFAHRADYSAARGRIETDIVSRVAQTVHIAGHRFDFAAEEAIRVEYSCKYDQADIDAMAAAAGLIRGPQWQDAEGLFAVQLLDVPPAASQTLV